MDFLVRCPGVGFTVLRQPRAEIRNPVGVGEFLVRCPGVGFTALRQPQAEIRNPVGVDGSSSPTGIRILARGCRSETEATLGQCA